jgi:hypothetical protein
MTTPPRLPNWPPSPGEKIGVDRSRAYVAWVREHAGPVLDEARAMLLARYPHAEISTSATSVKMLAERSLSATMPGLAIGCVYCSIGGGTWAMVDILISRDGQLVAKAGWNMKER